MIVRQNDCGQNDCGQNDWRGREHDFAKNHSALKEKCRLAFHVERWMFAFSASVIVGGRLSPSAGWWMRGTDDSRCAFVAKRFSCLPLIDPAQRQRRRLGTAALPMTTGILKSCPIENAQDGIFNKFRARSHDSVPNHSVQKRAVVVRACAGITAACAESRRVGTSLRSAPTSAGLRFAQPRQVRDFASLSRGEGSFV